MKERGPKRADLDVKYILKTYWNFIKKYKILLSSLLFCGLLLSSLGFIGRFLLKKIIDNGELFAKNQINAQSLIEATIFIILIWLAINVGSSIMRWVRVHLLNQIESKTIFDLKQYYYGHILTLSHKFHTTHKTGSLISRMGRGSNSMERMTDFISYQILSLVFEIIISGIALIMIDRNITYIILATGIIFVIYSYRLQKYQRKLNLISNRAEDIEKAFTADTFTNIDSIKHYGKEYLVKNRYNTISGKTQKAQLKQWNIGRWNSSVESLIMSSGGLLVLFVSIKSFMNGNTTLGTITFVWAAYWAIINSVQSFMEGLRGYNRSIADFHDLFQYGKESNDIKDKPNAKNIEINEGIIEFNDVSFKYHERSLFKNFNLKIEKNKKVALVGHSGSGKSTMVKLLYRLYDLDSGEIIIDGQNIKDVKQESLRSELSVVPQECVLFDDTIYNNILFSNPKASRNEVLQAIRFAQLDKTIKEFPYKENTIVGERGVKLSGGEKQRVSIARAILANKKVLVLDEATSSLDSKTESEIQKDLQKLMQNRTSIIIAHRLSTIMSADTIVVLDKGKIVQKGTHNQLISQPGTYQELWSLQKGGYLKE